MSVDILIPSLMAPLFDKITGEKTEFVKAAGIIWIEDKSVWARSDLFNLTQEEINTLVNQREGMYSMDLSLMGQGYMVLRNAVDDELPCVLKGKTGEKNNACISKSKKALIVVVGLETSLVSGLADRADKIAKLLKDDGY